MKITIIHIAFLISMSFSAYAQTIVSGAENTSTNKYIVNWTLGNTINGSINNKKYKITQGALFNTYRMYFEEGSKLEIACFPNPINEYFFLEIKSNDPEQYRWTIVTETGKIVASEKAYNSLIKIDASPLNAQLYFIYLLNKRGDKMASAKLIKQ